MTDKAKPRTRNVPAIAATAGSRTPTRTAPADQPTICVVDDDAAVRESLVYLMDSVNRPVETFESAEQFLERFDPERHAVVLLDVRMPGMSGLQLQQKLVEMNVRVPVIILTAHADVPMAVRAMRAGAYDFIEKPCNEQVLLERLGRALGHAEQLHAEEERQREATARHQTLSPREAEVMALVVQGQLNKQIARQLDVSERTVEVHRSRVMLKMKADSLPDLVRMATLLKLG